MACSKCESPTAYCILTTNGPPLCACCALQEMAANCDTEVHCLDAGAIAAPLGDYEALATVHPEI